MKQEDLIKAVSYIQLEEKTQERMVGELVERYGEGQDKRYQDEKYRDKSNSVHRGRGLVRYVSGYTKAAAVILAVAVAAGISVPAYALVNSYVKARMEVMPQETVNELYDQVQEAPVEADSFNRDYSAGEKQRWEKLYAEYQEGRFPEKELLQAGSEEEAFQWEQQGNICFLPALSRFYLPLDREMTDEELLEVLDFVTKRDYALTKISDLETAMARDTIQTKKERQIQVNINRGGISEEEAIEIAENRVKELGLDVIGFAMNHYYDDGQDMGVRYGKAAYYQVNWSNISSHTYYYFWVNAEDGTILDEHIGDNYSETVEKLIAKNVENGGITEEKAIDFAKARLKELGLDVEGYQQKVLFYEERPGDDFNEGGAFYQVSWYSQEALKYYYFMLDAGNGELLDERIFEEFTRVPGALD